MIIQPLLDKLEERKEALARLDRERETLMAQIAAYEDAIRLLQAPTSQSRRPSSDARQSTPRGQLKGRRRIKVEWANLIRDLSNPDGSVFGYDEIMRLVELRKYEVKRNVARAQMKLYSDAGFVERVSDGKFRITADGRRAAEESLKTEEALPGMTPDNASKPVDSLG